ncbi:MAG: hypothetical protein H7296_11405 [Bacteroidia bacterium]|nr:hypothetical protein [Bacteroidia bacterium]
MKNLILFLSLLTVTLSTKNIAAQGLCDFDTILSPYTEVIYKIKKSNSLNPVTGGFSGINGNTSGLDHRSFCVTKFDKCANQLW